MMTWRTIETIVAKMVYLDTSSKRMGRYDKDSL
jgi:hypothetical protein